MKKIGIKQQLFIFCSSLIILRLWATQHYSFLFLFWNLFLAWLPWFFASRISSSQALPLRLGLLLASVLFLPNAPYILTDLFHLKKQLLAPLWFDTILILSFALLGLIYFLKSAERLLEEINRLISGRVAAFAKPLLFLACGYGVYLGRYLRFNSWDLFLHPFRLANGMYRSVFHSGQITDAIGMTLTFTVFLYLVFEIYISFSAKQQQSRL